MADKPERRTEEGCDTANQLDDNPNLFVFAYDWRLDNAHSAALLKEYIRCIHRFYPGTEVNIIAHSMGGIVARRYILDNADDHHVNALIAIASPWLGAPKAIYAFETGEFLDKLGHLATISKQTLAEILPSFPASGQLFASPFYDDIAGMASFRDNGGDMDNDGNTHEEYSYDDVVALMNREYGRENILPGTINRVFHSHTTPQGQQSNWRTPPDATGVKYYHIWGATDDNDTIWQVQSYKKRACWQPGKCTVNHTGI